MQNDKCMQLKLAMDEVIRPFGLVNDGLYLITVNDEPIIYGG